MCVRHGANKHALQTAKNLSGSRSNTLKSVVDERPQSPVEPHDQKEADAAFPQLDQGDLDDLDEWGSGEDEDSQADLRSEQHTALFRRPAGPPGLGRTSSGEAAPVTRSALPPPVQRQDSGKHSRTRPTAMSFSLSAPPVKRSVLPQSFSGTGQLTNVCDTVPQTQPAASNTRAPRDATTAQQRDTDCHVEVQQLNGVGVPWTGRTLGCKPS